MLHEPRSVEKGVGPNASMMVVLPVEGRQELVTCEADEAFQDARERTFPSARAILDTTIDNDEQLVKVHLAVWQCGSVCGQFWMECATTLTT